MFRSLTTRVIATTISLLVAGIFIYTTFNVRQQQDMLIDTARESTELLLHTVESMLGLPPARHSRVLKVGFKSDDKGGPNSGTEVEPPAGLR